MDDGFLDAREDDHRNIQGLYFFTMVFTILNALISSAFFFRQRNKFPINGHHPTLSILTALSVMFMCVADAFSGLTSADTCTIATAVTLIAEISGGNYIGAIAIRLWFQYNLADERVKARQSGDSSPGWFAKHKRYFSDRMLVVVASVAQLIETAVIVVFIVLLEDAVYDTTVGCDEMAAILSFTLLFASVLAVFFLFVLMKFRHKRDGLGIKSQLGWTAGCALPMNLIAFSLFAAEAVTDYKFHVLTIRLLVFFVGVNLTIWFMVGRPVYQSLSESAQEGMSSISQVVDEDTEASQVEKVMQIANASLARADKDIELGTLASSSSDAAVQNDPEVQDAAPTGTTEEQGRPALISSATLSLTVEDVIFNPLYSPQLTSFCTHLVGEFNVEGLLFIFNVLNFQKFVTAAKTKHNEAPKPQTDQVLDDAASEKSELSRFSDSSSGEKSVSVAQQKSAPAHSGGDDVDKEVAWKALSVYFEFLADFAPAQINIGHRVQTPIVKEFDESIGDFHHLAPHVSPADLDLKRPLDVTIFDKAQKSVLLLLERDPFVRWKRAIRTRYFAAEEASSAKETTA